MSFKCVLNLCRTTLSCQIGLQINTPRYIRQLLCHFLLCTTTNIRSKLLHSYFSRKRNFLNDIFVYVGDSDVLYAVVGSSRVFFMSIEQSFERFCLSSVPNEEYLKFAFQISLHIVFDWFVYKFVRSDVLVFLCCSQLMGSISISFPVMGRLLILFVYLFTNSGKRRAGVRNLVLNATLG